MSNVKDTIKIAGHELKNRIAFLPIRTFPFEGKNQGVDYYYDVHIEHYTKVVEGGPGLVIVQGTNVKGISDDTYNWTPGSRETLKKIAALIKNGGATAMIQLSWGGDRETDLNAVSTEFLKQKQDELLKGILTVYDLGFDGVEIHYAHGFLLAKMLNKEENLRTDCYGGSIENRARVITDILPEVRKVTGEDFIVCTRIGPFLPDLETGIETAKYLESIGVNMISASHAMQPPQIDVPEDFILGPVTYSANLIKKEVQIPVIACMGMNDRDKMHFILGNDYADIAGIGRAILADYDFPNAILNNTEYSKCIRCKNCFWFTNDNSKCPARKVTK